MDRSMDEFLRSLHSFGQTRLFRSGSTLLFQGEVPRRAFVVLDGYIRAYSINSSGEELVAAFFCKGDILPLPWLFDATTNSLFFYEAMSEVRVLAVSKDDFKKQLASDPAYMQAMLRFQNKQYTASLLRITGLEQSRAIEKIAYTIYYLLFRYGTETTPGAYTIEMKLSQATVANLVGLTRESTTRALGLLKKKGIIKYQRSNYTVYKQPLENFIGEDSFRELSL